MEHLAPLERYRARFILTNDRVVEGGVLECAGGKVCAIHDAGVELDGVVELGDVALAPGLVNAHSHAFQRAIRGRTEWLHRDRPDEDFWSWREAMYSAALSYSGDDIERVARRAFWEMALTGVTAVGEFHYIHHQQDGSVHQDPNELAHRVIKAARDVGIRISLLRVAYHRAGFERPADPMQRRFVEDDVSVYLERLEQLRASYDADPFVTVGSAPHSIRAIPGDWFSPIAEWCERHAAPLHIHACEQRGELEQSIAEYGKTPIEALEHLGLFDGVKVTLVHATHLSEAEIGIIRDREAIVCACPSTERNLGDGFLPALELMHQRVPICLGSDSHTMIDMWDEARQVEYHERLRYEKRNVLAQAWGAWRPGALDVTRREVASLLWPMLAEHGARAIGQGPRGLEVGEPADFVALDLWHASLLGADAESLRSDVVLSMKPGAVRDVFVGGEAIVKGGAHVSLDPRELV